ncbi:hypothetical protein CMUS01_00051 [Colletotrichum musicola]|uniref:HNH nuclease domain-containing protein n=1 Tax=Colletotrichum musicola TaxID=2175873 RepID=A0A8H6NZI7_9PEZI|nr:hypothetical protein CMUS01_00051 [Colletotrichum musicola]
MEMDIHVDHAPSALENVLASITAHPLANGSLQHDDYVRFMNNSQRRNDLVSRYDNIIESYRPDLTVDDTIKIIRSFRRFLSAEGQTNLMFDLEQQILQRDGYKCAFTGNYDQDTVNHGHVLLPDGAHSSFTRITPIISSALGTPTGEYEDEVWKVAAVGKIWSSLFRYFPFLHGKINHDSLDQYQNLVTFDVAVQEHFETRTIAFQPSAEGMSYFHICFPAKILFLTLWIVAKPVRLAQIPS